MLHRIFKGHWFVPHFDGGWDKWLRVPTADGCEICMTKAGVL